jgi:hypothetical protein
MKNHKKSSLERAVRARHVRHLLTAARRMRPTDPAFAAGLRNEAATLAAYGKPYGRLINEEIFIKREVTKAALR